MNTTHSNRNLTATTNLTWDLTVTALMDLTGTKMLTRDLSVTVKWDLTVTKDTTRNLTVTGRLILKRFVTGFLTNTDP